MLGACNEGLIEGLPTNTGVYRGIQMAGWW